LVDVVDSMMREEERKELLEQMSAANTNPNRHRSHQENNPSPDYGESLWIFTPDLSSKTFQTRGLLVQYW
jgi:hypothetical protein